MRPATFLAVLATAASAARQGFNYGNTFTTGEPKTKSDFEAEFALAANLKKGPVGFSSARLYTMIQAGTTNDPISAIPAGIRTRTSLLLGLWASAGDDAFANEILALKGAIETYGYDLSRIVDGISIGSEDLYRNSTEGVAAGAGVGVGPDVLVNYIKQVKKAIAETPLEGVMIGHVDTWSAWVDPGNSDVVDALDWLGMDAYPYFETTVPNAIDQSKSLFDEALKRTRKAAGKKEVWITETGHPVSGNTSGDSVASVENAEKYWKAVGCPIFGEINTWWYTLRDAAPDTPNPSFGIISNGSTTPLFDIKCHEANNEPTSSSSPPPCASPSDNKPTAAEGTDGVAATASEPECTPMSPSGGSSSSMSSSQLSTNGSITPTSTGMSTTSESVTVSSPATSGGTGATTSPTPSGTSPSAPNSTASSLRYWGLGAALIAIVATFFCF